MKKYQIHKHIICIDLKSFYASVECALRGLDPFTTPLVVADQSRGNGALCLAVTPYLKSLGISSRARLFDIPDDIKPYIIYAKPQMHTYLEFTMKIIEIYLSYVSDEDLYVYSIDEAFLDVTHYLSLYKMTDVELGKKIVNDIREKLHLHASCGVGPNMLISKLAMDLDSKHQKDSIAKWTYEDIPEKLWPITPLSEMWGIGNRMERNLNFLGMQTIGDIANYDVRILKDHFGVLGEELYYHCHGIDMSLIQDKDKLRNRSKSFGISQVLFHDYQVPEIYTIILEMADEITRRLRMNKKRCRTVHFGVGYSLANGGGLHQQITLEQPTSSFKEIYHTCLRIFHNQYDGSLIRSVSVSLSGLTDSKVYQYSIFEDAEAIEKEYQLLSSIDAIKSRYGKNAVNRAESLEEHSTIIKRYSFVGGHDE
jgi:DNA polymerase V